MTKNQPEKVFRLHISLKHIKPPIWRRLLVTEDTTLGQLHKIIQILMGWEDYHMHLFEIGQNRFGMIEDEWDSLFDEDENEDKVTLADLNLAEKQKFLYTYDFGDNWNHIIKVEKILPFDPAVKYPQCIAGQLPGPPEDCGGVWGYEDLLELSKKPKDEQSEEERDSLEWLGDYDFEHFSVDEINAKLRKQFAK